MERFQDRLSEPGETLAGFSRCGPTTTLRHDTPLPPGRPGRHSAPARRSANVGES